MYEKGQDNEFDSHLDVILQDFTIADAFGISAIKDTYNRIFRDFKSDYKMMTALTVATNWKIFEHFNRNNMEVAKKYDSLWRKADEYCITNLKGEELEFFYETTD